MPYQPQLPSTVRYRPASASQLLAFQYCYYLVPDQLPLIGDRRVTSAGYGIYKLWRFPPSIARVRGPLLPGPLLNEMDCLMLCQKGGLACPPP